MVTIQDTPGTPYILYSLYDHVNKKWLPSPDGNSDFWTREQLFDAISTFPKVSLMIWNGFIYVNEFI